MAIPGVGTICTVARPGAQQAALPSTECQENLDAGRSPAYGRISIDGSWLAE